MPQWGNKDQANNAPKWKNIATGSSVPNRGNTVYANVTSGAFITGESIGVFGVDLAEAATVQPKQISPGWVLTRQGTGGIVKITTNSGTGFVNTDIITISSPQAGGNAKVTFVTNATGVIQSSTIVNPGAGFLAVNATANVFVTNATGGTATGNTSVTGMTAVAGGHAGRIFREPLVIVRSMANNAASGGGSTTP